MRPISDQRIEVGRAIAATPSEVFAVVSSPQGHVAIDASGMLMSASGDRATAVGDVFTVHMDREALNDYPLGLYDVDVRIIEFEQDRRIAWTIESAFLQPSIGHVYGYEIQEIPEGCVVTQFYDWSGIHEQYRETIPFPIVPESALRATLGILARTVAPGMPRPILDEGA